MLSLPFFYDPEFIQSGVEGCLNFERSEILLVNCLLIEPFVHLYIYPIFAYETNKSRK